MQCVSAFQSVKEYNSCLGST